MKSEKNHTNISLLESIINFSEDAIISKTLEGIITSWNNGAEKIFGYTAEEITGRHISVLIPPTLINEEQEIIEKIKVGECIAHYETPRLKKDGNTIYISLTVSPVKDEHGTITGASKICRDITQRKLAEEERTKMIEEIVQRNKDLEQFSYIISHNLRAPVANLMGISDLLEKGNLDESERNFLMEGLSASVKKLENIILDLNHITQLKLSVNEHREPVNFSTIVDDIKTTISNIIDNKAISIYTDFSEVETFDTVRNFMYSIFYNLITNSIKYKQPGLPLICDIRSKKEADKVLLFFKDNGMGIDLEKTGTQIFDIYKRFYIGAAEGKGLGLFMVKSHVESMRGTISVTSEVNKGTEFRLEFPMSVGK